MKHRIISEEYEYEGFFNFKKLKIEFESFKGKTKQATIEVFDRGDSAAIVLFEKDTNSLILVRQFRFPTTKHGSGWIDELVAGKIEENESGDKTIKRESIEEIGYQVKSIEEIGSYYLSPGGTTERIFLYYSEVSKSDKTKDGGGEDGSSEDIETVKYSVEELEKTIKEGVIVDAKTVIGFQWFVSNKKSNGA